MKMNFLSVVIISFALVNVLVATKDKGFNVLTDYYEEVVKTNEHLKDAQGGLLLVLKYILAIGKYSMEEMAYMMALPELTDMNLTQKINCQIKMRKEITNATSIIEPNINTDDFDWDVDVEVYGKKRRCMIMEAIKDLIKFQQRGEAHDFKNFNITCRLVGLFKSVKFPDSYVLSAIVNDDEECILVPIKGRITVYKSFGGIIWQINDDNTLHQPITDQF